MKTTSTSTSTALTGLSILAALALAGPASAAVTISFSPSAQTVGVGETATVDLIVSGLGNLSAPSLGGWGINFGYDPSIVSITMADVTFGSLLDLGTFGSDADGLADGGSVSLFELSFEDPIDLQDAQPASFTLATLNFTALAPGSSPLSLTFIDLTDELGDMIETTGADGVIRVRDDGNGTAVPETAVGLLPLALLWTTLLAVSRRLRPCARPA